MQRAVEFQSCLTHRVGQRTFGNHTVETVTTLRQRLGREAPEGASADGLNAVIFRLRRRIERATPTLVPLQSKSRVGYVFRAPLRVV